MARQYRLRREDDRRTITTVHPGQDARAIIAEAVAAEFEVAQDDLAFAEEFDSRGDWTGEELILIDGQTVARLQMEW